MNKAMDAGWQSVSRAVLVIAVMGLGSRGHAQGAPGTSTVPGARWPIASVRFGGTGENTPNAAGARMLNGFVRDAQDKPVVGALVYLKDVKTAKTLSVSTGAKGEYGFVGLANNTDYEFWAKAGEHTSEIKKVSSFDNTVQMTRQLVVK